MTLMESEAVPDLARRGQKAFVAAARLSEASALPDCGQGARSNASGGCPVVGEKSGEIREADCPVISESFQLRRAASTDNEASSPQAKFFEQAQAPANSSPGPDSRAGRDTSSPLKDTGWMYPSERMFYEAMKRRGWNPSLQDLQAVVSLHSPAMERAWSEVLAWEQLHCNKCKESYLRECVENMTKVSPKAKLQHLTGQQLPFDRQDWIISRCGKDVRYVVDFYNAAPLPDMPIALHLDVRPALDSAEALLDRIWARMHLTVFGESLGAVKPRL